MTASRSLLVLALLLAGCLVDFPPLPTDGGSRDTSTDSPAGDIAAADGFDLLLPDSSPVDGPAPDVSVPDSAPPDPDAAPPPPCSSDWSLWSCSSAGNSCSAVCPASGAALLTLDCTKNNCTCTKGTSTKQCSSSGAGCATCANAFQAGCCNGL